VSKALVLLSGGLDSMATAALLSKSGHEVSGLFIDFGQPACEREASAVSLVAARLEIPLRVCALPALRPPYPGLLPGRNGLFLHVALHLATPFAGLLALGIHSGSRYPDCGPPFVLAAQSLLDLYTGGTVSLVAPFVDTTKEGIWAYCLDEGLPVDLTYSCELGLDQPCNRCLSCDDRRRLAASA
jgi:7-cyano-7-deazaguanine synthase